MEWFVFAWLLFAASGSASPLGDQLPRHEGYVESYDKVTISPFLQVIRTSDLAVRDAIYSTPAVVFVGKKSEVLRCRHEDPNECEVYVTTITEGYATSLHVSGDYLYVGLHNGTILKCNLYQKDLCKNFHTGSENVNVNGLVTANGYLYGSLSTGTMLRCELNTANSCRPFHFTGSRFTSLTIINEYIFAGLANGTLLRCSLTTKNSCMPLYTMNSLVVGIKRVENDIFVISYEPARLWNCTLRSDTTIDSCASVPMNFTTARTMTSFKGILYTLEFEKGLYACKWENNTHSHCSKYGNFDNAWSIAFAFRTYNMQSRYNNEDKACPWQRQSKCPPFVTYYDARERAALEVHVKGGKLYNAQGLLVDTADADEGRTGPAAIFVMGPDGTILLSNRHVSELLHTSSLLAGGPVSGVGEMFVDNGKIVKITSCSAHYWPDLDLNRQVVESLRAQGYTDRIYLQSCGDGDGEGASTEIPQTESNELRP